MSVMNHLILYDLRNAGSRDKRCPSSFQKLHDLAYCSPDIIDKRQSLGTDQTVHAFRLNAFPRRQIPFDLVDLWRLPLHMEDHRFRNLLPAEPLRIGTVPDLHHFSANPLLLKIQKRFYIIPVNRCSPAHAIGIIQRNLRKVL